MPTSKNELYFRYAKKAEIKINDKTKMIRKMKRFSDESEG